MAQLATIAVAVIALLTTLVNLVFGRRLQNANIESVSVKSAIELNARLESEVGGLRTLVDEQRQRLASMERRERLMNRRLAKHEAWDLRTVERARDAGLNLPDPPSLTDDDGDPNGPRTRAEDYGLPGTRHLT